MTKKKIRFYLGVGVFCACNNWTAPPSYSEFLSRVWIGCSIFLGYTNCRPQKWDWRAGLCQWFSMWGCTWCFALSSSKCVDLMMFHFLIQYLLLLVCVLGLFFWIPCMSFLHRFRFGVGSVGLWQWLGKLHFWLYIALAGGRGFSDSCMVVHFFHFSKVWCYGRR